jgi:transcriptional regulator with XRE-family HTH domain
MLKNDWVLRNINKLIEEKGMKLEYISAKLGISQGEVSKILKGERDSYTKYVYQFSQILNEPYHEIIKNDEVNQYNYGEIKDNGIGNVHTFKKALDIEVYEHRVKDKDDIILLEREQKMQEREQKEYWKAKYYKLKEKFTQLESENIKFSA